MSSLFIVLFGLVGLAFDGLFIQNLLLKRFIGWMLTT